MRNGERDAAPRLNPRLNPRQLWMMANDPDWRPWMILIVNHRNAWPELRAWFAAGRGDRPARRAPAAGHADRAAATGRHGHVHTHGTRGPRVGRRGDRDAGTGTPIDDLAAVADEAGPAATHVAWKPVAIGIAATLAAVAWNRIGRVRAERAEQAALETARSDCARASKSLRAAMDAYEALKAGKAADTAKTTAKQVEDARTVAALDKALNAKEPKAVACTADTRAGYERQTSRVDANRDWYKEHKASLAKAVEAVGESRDAKTITDAKKLLNDSKGKVQDERTRDALDKAIKARHAGDHEGREGRGRFRQGQGEEGRGSQGEGRGRGRGEGEGTGTGAGAAGWRIIRIRPPIRLLRDKRIRGPVLPHRFGRLRRFGVDAGTVRALAVHAELGRSVDGRPGRTARQGPEHVTEPEYRNTGIPINRHTGIPESV